MACSSLQITASCFDLNGLCVSTCRNKVDADCQNAGMYGYVRNCKTPRLARPQVNEGWRFQSTSKSLVPIIVGVSAVLLILICVFVCMRGHRQ